MAILLSTHEESVRLDEKYAGQLGNLFWRQLDQYTGSTLFVDYATARHWTGNKIKTKAAHVASYLKNVVKLPAESHCVLMYDHCGLEMCIALGLMFAGSSIVSWNPIETKSGKKSLISDIKPKVVFCDASNLSQCLEIRAVTSQDFIVCVIDDDKMVEPLTEEQRRFVIGYQHDIISHQVNDMHELPVQVSPDHAAFVLMTSGSTARPKPVIKSQRNLLYEALTWSIQFGGRFYPEHPDSVYAGFSRLEYLSGIVPLLRCFTRNEKILIMPSYKIELFMDAVDRYKITDCIMITPTLHQLMVACLSTGSKLLEQYDVSSLRCIYYGGAKLTSRRLLERFQTRIGDRLSLLEIYGATEAGGVTVEPVDRSKQEPDSVGLLTLFQDVKLVDLVTAEEIAEVGREGELLVRGPRVTPGYLGDEFKEQQRAAFSADGFYKTGDIARMSPSNQLIIDGRCKEMLLLSSYCRALPSEFESLLMEMPQIQEVAVVGIPNKELLAMQDPRAYCVLKPESRGLVKESDVIEFVASRAWRTKQLTGGVRFMSELRQLANGKIDKNYLKQLEGF